VEVCGSEIVSASSGTFEKTINYSAGTTVVDVTGAGFGFTSDRGSCQPRVFKLVEED